MRYDQLPAKMRAQVDAQIGRSSSSSRARPSRGGTGDGQPCEYRCACSATFESFTKWERHSRSNGAGHSRGEQVLEQTD